jgi:hypothetical protein
LKNITGLINFYFFFKILIFLKDNLPYSQTKIINQYDMYALGAFTEIDLLDLNYLTIVNEQSWLN